MNDWRVRSLVFVVRAVAGRMESGRKGWVDVVRKGKEKGRRVCDGLWGREVVR